MTTIDRPTDADAAADASVKARHRAMWASGDYPALIPGPLSWTAMGNAHVPLPERPPPWSGWPAFRAGAGGGRRCTGSAWKSSQPR
jgi:hypothetical protein